MTSHEDSRHNCDRSGHPGRGCRPEHRIIIPWFIPYKCQLEAAVNSLRQLSAAVSS